MEYKELVTAAMQTNDPVLRAAVEAGVAAVAGPLEEDLRCPICMELKPEMVVACANGHSLCSECAARMQQEQLPCACGLQVSVLAKNIAASNAVATLLGKRRRDTPSKKRRSPEDVMGSNINQMTLRMDRFVEAELKKDVSAVHVRNMSEFVQMHEQLKDLRGEFKNTFGCDFVPKTAPPLIRLRNFISAFWVADE